MAKVHLIPVAKIQESGYRFRVPAYQRGYRWTEKEVTLLLKDLWEFAEQGNGDSFYCLQPLVVQQREDGTYEVLDGQQRLTTLYILLKALHRKTEDAAWEPKFTITYETREKSRDFLENLPEKNQEEAMENPDFFHMWLAYQTIVRWLEKHAPPEKLPKFEDVLLRNDDKNNKARNARFIWYELEPQREAPQKIFVRLNSGKVPLADSELIRAHILLLEKKEANSRLEERARLLDDVRLAFEEDAFWYFFSPADYPVRMDRLFELFPEAPVRDDRYTLAHWFLEHHKSGKEIWETIQDTFAYLRFLYENDEFYNLVGWTVALREAPDKTQTYLRGVLKMARENPKSSLRAHLYREANCTGGHEWLARDGKNIVIRDLNRDVRDLRYTEGIHLRRVLLLYNVLAFFPVKGWEEGKIRGRFPFHRYHAEKWSLEHIHPQAPTWFRGYNDAKAWLEEILGWMETTMNLKEERWQDLYRTMHKLKTEAEERSQHGENRGFRDFMEKLGKAAERLFARFGAGDVHDISNIALLPKNLNSELSNLPFPLKRQKLLEAEERGAFVPPRTRDVFLKTFAPAPADLHTWDPESREAYEHHIVETLKTFLDAIEKIAGRNAECGNEPQK